MYHPAIIAEQAAVAAAQPYVRRTFPTGVPQYSIPDTHALTASILQTIDPSTGEAIRPKTAEESRFAAAATIRVTYDAPYFLEGFSFIDDEGHGLRRLYPLWESQRFILDRIAALQLKHQQQRSPDGILVNILKARQLGASSVAMCLVAHRILTQPFIRAVAGSDVEEQARYLFTMVERIYNALPPFLKSDRVVPYQAGRELHLANGSSIKAAWGKTTRGALQEAGGRKGNIERGRTNSVVGISELATWDNPEQLDSALLPGIPVSTNTLVIFESTAELAGDWWHRHWQACQEGATPRDWSNIFIPWCVEPKKYSLPAPFGWTPSAETLAIAATIERDSVEWVGETVRVNRDQLYWYETTRAYYAKKNQLHQLLREMPSNPAECFQFAGRGVFTLAEQDAIDAAARPIKDVWAVEPSRDIAALKRLPPEEAAEDVKAWALQHDARPAAPLTPIKSPAPAAEYPVPAGYGFRRLGAAELSDLPSLRHSVLAIFEYPRARGQRRYTLGVDVGDGLGQDYSVISVIREPTIDEPAEEVAQYVSNRVRPSTLAAIVDAVGRFYADESGLEACVAVELNNHGISVQDMLQLHLGYGNFYVWEVVDAALVESRFTKRIGWTTTQRTRPILLEKFHDAVTSIDPISNLPDLRLNSPITRGELRFFVTEGTLGEADHAPGQHDDAIFGTAIGYYVAHRLSGGESEPIAERRRRRAALREFALTEGQARPDWRNSAVSADAAKAGQDDDADEDFGADAPLILYFDPRATDRSS